MNRKYILYFFIIFSLISCERKITQLEFEQNAFDQIFLKVVNMTYKDQRLYTLFPELGKDLYDKKGKWVGSDSIGQHQRDLDCELKRNLLKRDTINLIIALNQEGLIDDKTNLEKYKNAKFIFKRLWELPYSPEFQNWKNKYSKFAGVMSFSRIKFDAKNETGTLSVDYSCGGKCGLGYSVTIKRINEKWIIFKVEELWIS